MRSAPSSWLAIVVTVVLAACASPALPGKLTATELPLPTSPQSPALTTPAEKVPAIEQAISDLAARLDTPPSEIEIVTQEAVTWPDGSLDCPKPGINYIQVPVDGLRIILGHAGTTYEYHTSQSVLVLCETIISKPALTPIPFQSSGVLTPEIDMTSSLQIELGLQPLIDTAIVDLANRLSIDRNVVEVVSAQSVVWPDRSLGCPQPGMAYIQVLADGYRIELRVKDQVYSYHGGEGRGPFLCENLSK